MVLQRPGPHSRRLPPCSIQQSHNYQHRARRDPMVEVVANILEEVSRGVQGAVVFKTLVNKVIIKMWVKWAKEKFASSAGRKTI